MSLVGPYFQIRYFEDPIDVWQLVIEEGTSFTLIDAGKVERQTEGKTYVWKESWICHFQKCHCFFKGVQLFSCSKFLLKKLHFHHSRGKHSERETWWRCHFIFYQALTWSRQSSHRVRARTNCDATIIGSVHMAGIYFLVFGTRYLEFATWYLLTGATP